MIYLVWADCTHYVSRKGETKDIHIQNDLSNTDYLHLDSSSRCPAAQATTPDPESGSEDSTIIIVCSVSGVLILALTAALVVVYRWYRTSMNHPVHVVQPRFGSQYDYEDGYTTRQSCQQNFPKVYRIIRSLLVLKQPTSAFTLKNLGRHYAK